MQSTMCRSFLLVAAALLWLDSAGAAEPEAPGVTLMRTPNGGIQPQAAVDDDGTVHLIYFQGDPAAGDLFYVHRRKGDQSFSAPMRVNSHPGSAIAVGSIRGAQLAVASGGRVHVVWNGSNQAQPRVPGAEHDTPMLYARLNDAMTQFEPQRNLIQHAHGLDGGGSIAADGQGNVYVAWHANPAGDGEANRRIYLAKSTDAGRTFATEIPVSPPDTGVCSCCGMKIWIDRSGRLLMLYRAAKAVVHRDVYLLASNDGGQTFDSQMLDPWHVATCPMSSAAFAEGSAGVLAGWETAGQVRFGRIGADGKGAERPLRPAGPASGQKHPAAAINDQGETLLVWTEGTGWNRGGSVAWRRYDAAGRPLGLPESRDGVPVWSFATALADPQAGWTIIY